MGNLSFTDEYVQKLAEGDPEVQSHFISHFSTLLRVKLRNKLRSPQLIEDVRQETFLRVFQCLKKEHGIHNSERLGAFVNSVCNNVMLECFRSAGRNQQIPEDYPDLVDKDADPSREVVTGERRKVVAQLLAELPSRDRDLLRQVFLEERDKDSICSEMNVNSEYLRVLIHRAKGRFRERLLKSEPTASRKNLPLM